MTDDNNPEGTVEDDAHSPEEDVDGLLDKVLADPEEDTGEPEAETETEEAESEEDPDDAEDSDDEDDAEQEDEGQPRDEKGRFLSNDAKVRLDDGTVVTVGELKQGSLRQADYTRKTQELAEQRRQFDEVNTRIAQAEQDLQAKRDFLLRVAQANIPQEPDISMLRENPIEYWEQKHAYDQRVKDLQALQHQSQQEQHNQQQQTAQQRQAQLRSEWEQLLESEPDLKDQAKFQAFQKDALEIGQTYGFTHEELGAVADHRALRILRDAVRWRKFQANKPKAMEKTKGAPPVQPARRQEPKAKAAQSKQRDMQKLRSTGGRDEHALDRLLDQFI